MDLKEKLTALGIGSVKAFFLTVIASIAMIVGINYLVEYLKPEYTGLFANLLTVWYNNPLIIGSLAGGIRSYFGWLENFFENGGEDFNSAKMATTWAIYWGAITLFSQGLPVGMSIVLAVLGDLIVRAIKHE